MKKGFYLILLVAAVCTGFMACSNGDYVANPANPTNGSLNPLNPPVFDWTGTGEFSAVVDGVAWLPDSNQVVYIAANGNDYISAIKGTGADAQAFTFAFNSAYSGNTYPLDNGVTATTGVWFSDYTNGIGYASSAGNVGAVDIIENDSVRIKGLFYFQGRGDSGRIANITKGYFNIPKNP